MRALASILISLWLLAGGPLNAGQPDGGAPLTVEPDRNTTDSSVTELAHLIDLWHDANLKANTGQVHQWQDQIVSFLRSDIERTRWHYDACRKRAEALDRPSSLSPQEQRLLDELTDADQWLKVKKRLLRGFEKSAAFSNRYRLLNDYVQVLRLESDRLQVKVADGETPSADDSGESAVENGVDR